MLTSTYPALIKYPPLAGDLKEKIIQTWGRSFEEWGYPTD